MHISYHGHRRASNSKCGGLDALTALIINMVRQAKYNMNKFPTCFTNVDIMWNKRITHILRFRLVLHVEQFHNFSARVRFLHLLHFIVFESSAS